MERYAFDCVFSRTSLCNSFFQQVRTAILKWISVYMSLRGHHDWAVRRTSMFSRNYATEAEIEQQLPSHNNVNDNTKR